MRIPYLLPDQLTPEQRALYDAIAGGKRSRGSKKLQLATPEGGLVGPFNAWLTSPEVGDRIQQLGAALRFSSSLSDPLLELAILVTARHWRARFEWWAHAPMARRSGVDERVIEAIRTGREPELEDPAQRTVYRFSRELLERHEVSEGLYEEAREHLGERGLVDLVSLLGYYGLVSMTLNTFEVPLPPGEPDPFV